MSLERTLAAAVGARHLITDREVRRSYERDWTGRFGAPSRCVVRPGSADEVAEVVRACAAAGAPLVPQGGNTGLVGAGVPRGGEVVLSTLRLDDVGEVDTALGQVEAGAGATLAALQRRAHEAGMDAQLDFAARDAATLGGIVACDAGGARALSRGTARARVSGLEAVLPDGGRVSRLSGLLKDNAGLDLPAVIVGSEGTLGVVTRVRWRLGPLLPERLTALAPLASIADAVALLAALRAHAPSLDACDFFLAEGLRLVLARSGGRLPVADAPVYVLADLAARRDPAEELVAALTAAGVGLHDVAVAQDATARAGLWALREGHTEAINALGVPHKIDVGVPLTALPAFADAVPAKVADVAPGARVILFGHLGDGNVHVNVLGPDPDDHRIEDAVLALALAMGGTISAEHGVGVAKAHWLARGREPDEVRAMRAIKDALDPQGIMNPGAVFSLPR